MVQIQPTGSNALTTNKSHQRQLVDRSDPVYKKAALKPTNPTNGSWWIVQIQPTGSNALTTKKFHQRKFVDGSSPAFETRRERANIKET